jgi:hypothetical protein
LAVLSNGHCLGVPHDPEDTVMTDMAALLHGATSPTVVAGRYVLHRTLGVGGAAVVYEATDTRLDRSVAVKLLRDTSGDATARKRFVSEARLLAGLSHPHLVQVLDAGIDEDHPYLVLELIRGRTLGDAMSHGLPAAQLAEIGVDLAEALAHAHESGIVHRDVKPDNVLLTTDGTAKLADFGIARLVDGTLHHTHTGMLVGTVAYLAPEQVTGDPTGTAVDVYALGLVLLEALTGCRAYPGMSIESALARLSRPPNVPESLPTGWPQLLRAMTARDPAARPTARQVAERLRALETAAPTAATAVRPSASARRALVGVAAAFALLVAVAAWPGWPGWPGGAAAASAHRTPAGPAVASGPKAAAAAPGPTPVVAAPVAAPHGKDAAHRAAPRHHQPRHHKPRHHQPRHHKPKHHKPKHHKPKHKHHH